MFLRKIRASRQRFPVVETVETRLLLATLIVNGVEDTDARDSELTLREAIDVVDNTLPISSLSAAEQAQITGSLGVNPDQIDFAIPGSGVHTIAITSPLPAITVPVSIDGTTQPGAKPNDLATGDDAVMTIVLDGSKAGALADGLTLEASRSTVRGLVVSNFSGNGISLAANDGPTPSSADGALIAGDFLGTDATGETAAGNRQGIDLSEGSSSTIGGTAPADRNVISGNSTLGIYLTTGSITGTTIEGNLIGTDAKATLALPNVSGGIEVTNGVSASTIGGTVAGAGNVIAGNGGFGVMLAQGNSNLLIENLIYANSGTQIEDLSLATPSPTLSAATIYPSGTQILGSLPATTSYVRTDRVEFYTTSDSVAQPPTYLGSADVTTTIGFENYVIQEFYYIEDEDFDFSPTVAVAPGESVVATASSEYEKLFDGDDDFQGPSISTSESTSGFSAPFVLVAKPQTDLSVTAASTASTLHPGQEFTETFTVANLGPDDASNAMLTILLPVDAAVTPYSLSSIPSVNDIPSIDTVLSSNPSQGVVYSDGSYTRNPTPGYGEEADELNFPQAVVSLGTIAAGSKALFSIVLQAPDATPSSPTLIQATIASDTYDTDIADKSALTNPTYVADYDLVATSLTASSNAPMLGQPLTYSFVVTNHGPDIAGAVKVAVALPSTISDSNLRTLLPVGTIAPGGSRTASITVHPTALGGFSVSFDATTPYAAGETNPSNNDASLALTIQPDVGPKVVSVGPSSMKTRASALSVAFNESIDPTSGTNLKNYAIVSAGRDKKYGTKDDKSYAIASAQYIAATDSVVLLTKKKLSTALKYQLSVVGTSGGVTDASGTLLDGGTARLIFGKSALIVPKAPKMVKPRVHGGPRG